jgi:hypothetical protein
VCVCDSMVFGTSYMRGLSKVAPGDLLYFFFAFILIHFDFCLLYSVIFLTKVVN